MFFVAAKEPFHLIGTNLKALWFYGFSFYGRTESSLATYDYYLLINSITIHSHMFSIFLTEFNGDSFKIGKYPTKICKHM
jgi:hypothetical protein